MSVGNGTIKVRGAGVVLVLPKCPRCSELAPKCLCGMSAAWKAKHGGA